MKKTLSILFVSLFGVALLLLAAFAFREYRNQRVKDIVIHINRRGEKGFLSKKEIKALIIRNDSVIGKPIKRVNTAKLEKQIDKNPYVKQADVYMSIAGRLMVNVSEKTPLLQVFNLKNQRGYVDHNGTFFPLSNAFAPRVLPANGYIKTGWHNGENIFDKKFRNTSLPVLFLLAKKIEADRLLRVYISQLFVNSRGEVDLVPELGRYVIHFGDSTRMNVKLENLEAFIKQVFAHGGWSKYRSINLEFTNQVVCTKK